jgi:hypothetical protein
MELKRSDRAHRRNMDVNKPKEDGTVPLRLLLLRNLRVRRERV